MSSNIEHEDALLVYNSFQLYHHDEPRYLLPMRNTSGVCMPLKLCEPDETTRLTNTPDADLPIGFITASPWPTFPYVSAAAILESGCLLPLLTAFAEPSSIIIQSLVFCYTVRPLLRASSWQRMYNPMGTAPQPAQSRKHPFMTATSTTLPSKTTWTYQAYHKQIRHAGGSLVTTESSAGPT